MPELLFAELVPEKDDAVPTTRAPWEKACKARLQGFLICTRRPVVKAHLLPKPKRLYDRNSSNL